MTEVGRLLREADPLRHEAGPSLEDSQAMRRVVVEGVAPRREATWWPRPLVVFATVTLALAAGIAGGRWLETGGGRRVAEDEQRAALLSSPSERRQLQFATPGGTRIIWVFDSQFEP